MVADTVCDVVTISELAESRFLGALSSVDDVLQRPLTIVGLDTADQLSDSVVKAAVAQAERLPGVVVGVTSRALDPALDLLVEALDFTLSEVEQDDRRVVVLSSGIDQVVEQVRAAALASPRATTALSGLLRITSTLPPLAGLLAESFAYSTLLAGPEFAGWLATRAPRRDQVEPPRPPVRLELDDATLRITLDWPEKRNAYGRAMRDALVEALTLVELDPSIRSVELRGEGAAFCSGGDLDEFGTASDPATAHIIRTARSAGALLHRCRERVEVRVHGACIGAGVELPAFAARVMSARDAFFGLPEVAMGLVPGAGGTVSITHRIGRWRTTYLALSGTHLDAEAALRWGLVDALEPNT